MYLEVLGTLASSKKEKFPPSVDAKEEKCETARVSDVKVKESSSITKLNQCKVSSEKKST